MGSLGSRICDARVASTLARPAPTDAGPGRGRTRGTMPEETALKSVAIMRDGPADAKTARFVRSKKL
jgi:hypothetical protein